MRSMLLAALCVALPLGAAQAADPIEILPDAKAATGEIADVEINSMSFLTPEVTIKSGQTVRWTNREEGMAHNVHFRQGPAKTVKGAMGPMLNAGDAYAVKFMEPGTYNYICTPHSAVMKGKVIVE
ncbi:cupredoxin family copper-binding protein [Hansschlegelia sp.]|uniref:cupredoxin domain-containing protein n=1 Tax=Hansschlegelia sp. TaxID=2041892 RepID=UPI002C9F8B7C|nr:cupredoxin family copper-binding protein [Hansschlegelia sp.]HVI30055.1 cupredoxin family copper-binding protein [Hansschlegelia sp.]